MDEIYSIRPEERKPFAVTPEFTKVFNALGELDFWWFDAEKAAALKAAGVRDGHVLSITKKNGGGG